MPRSKARAAARPKALSAALTLPLLAGCEGAQSALAPAGEDAAVLATLFWVMLSGAVVLFLAMNGLFFYLTRIRVQAQSETVARWLIVGGGIVLPFVVISALLVWGLSILPDHRQAGDGLRIRVTGEQWWWRVEYWPEGATEPVISANEIRLPAGQRTELILDSAHVIHSFWIPALGGKMDMFPGRETFLSLRPTQPGTYRGQCAEFCGASHAWMAFEAHVMAPEAFDDWLAAQAGPAQTALSDAARRGAGIFTREGCGACHTIRGTEHIGVVGPDLTRVGSRTTLGAGRLGVSLDAYRAWITHTGDLKPEVEMPAYDHLSEAEATDLAQYLRGLE
ncbi:cytochrome c oxidase subunit II [Pararhodobacter marinus]|uniref:Cytochrome aa3 subunit 2 n=1 Tax=Pararhodobacter marinus TaxID=2184063 RepID=A0A2U2C5K0_9RHOB|nr:cytochrome c oxidase subunit II [Pararhodobacter marinus]PWE27165.1 cytochrome c oxidase subunit II [Pararhodobacter marinus]